MAFSPLLHSQSGGALTFWQVPPIRTPSLAWLGQAGFALRYALLRLLIDPYLSDSLDKKYRGTEKPHDRMMPSPLSAMEITGLDFVLCTHRHTDHMDPETLLTLSQVNPQCQFVVPRAERDHALQLGLPKDRIWPIDAGEKLPIKSECAIHALPSAHEHLEINAQGEYRCLGYVLRLGSFRVYHSGDTVPYAGLTESVKSHEVDLALLPVNGRRKGVAGNFTFDEAVRLCKDAAIPNLIPHHFGMFAFNTVDPRTFTIRRDRASAPSVTIPNTKTWWTLA